MLQYNLSSQWPDQVLSLTHALSIAPNGREGIRARNGQWKESKYRARVLDILIVLSPMDCVSGNRLTYFE